MKAQNLTILLTDIKGFTSKTASFSRAQTQQLLDRHRELVLPVIEKFSGRLVKTIGDAFLVVFHSPTDAVICGVEIQGVLKSYNEGKTPAEKIEIRIAINAGEVSVHDDGDIYGDPVNITSRLESIAEAGEVFFTEAVYLAMNKKEVPSSEIGYRQFKGIPEKIKVFRVLREIPVGAQPPGEAPAAQEPVPAAAPASPGAPAFAPAKARAAALAIDLLLFLVATGLVPGLHHSPVRPILWVVYQVVLFKKKGATLGMLIIGLRIIDTATGQKPAKTFWRCVMGLLSAIPLGLGYLWALWDKDGSTWHDSIAGTRIVKA